MLRRKRKKGTAEANSASAQKNKTKKYIRKSKRAKLQGKEEQNLQATPPRLREDRLKIDYKKRVRRNRRRRKILTGTFILLFLLCVLFFAPFFGVARIDVYGAVQMTQQEVVSASGIKMGENIFLLRISNVKKRIEALPFADSVKVLRGFPNVIKITVEESKPFAYIINDEHGFLLLDKGGKLLKIVDELPEQHFIQLITPPIENPIMGQTFSEENTIFLKKYLATVSEIVHNNIVEKISLIDVSIEDELNIKYNQLEVKLGDTEQLGYKFNNLHAILDVQGEKAKGRLDLSVPGKSYYKETIE